MNPPPVIRINSRFNGPPQVANGGFVCGTLASRMTGPVSVRLDAPVPVDTDLAVITTPDTVVLARGGCPLATARPAPHLPPPPPPPGLDAADEARRVGPGEYPIADCFVCGYRRHDGLGLAPGPTALDGQMATVWRPGPELAAPDGRVLTAMVWAALDCPSAFATLDPDEAGLLGTLHGHVHRRPLAGETLIVSSWPGRRDGRKRWAGTAIHTPAGELVASAAALWFAVDLGRFLAQETFVTGACA